jgi:site-specific recombinase XerD
MEQTNMEIMDDPYFKNFINTKRLSKSTERVYFGRLKSFCEFLGKNPSELIKEAQYGGEKRIDKYFRNYIENLKNSGKSSNTIINQLDTVKAFYKEYDIDTDGINRIISPITDIYLTTNNIISQDQIQEALELSSLRDKAIILFHISSGIEANELRHLTYGDFLNSIKEYMDLKPEEIFNIKKIEDKLNKKDQIVGTWKIEKNRTKRPYVTFNTPESTRAILSYLIDRERKNKPIKSLEDPLFVNSQNQALNVSAHGSIFKRINNRANFGYITRKRRFFSSTMLRKYFKTKLYKSEVDKETIKAILGQELNKDINYHSDEKIKELKNKYLGIVKKLSIERVNIETVTSEEYNNLIKQLNEKDKELEEIKKHLNHIKQIIE